MPVRVLHEAEAVAAARWEATIPPSERRQRQQEAQLRPFEEIAAQRWAATEPRGEDTAATTPEQPATGAPAVLPGRPPTYRLYDKLGQPIACHLCGHEDAWVAEDNGESRTVRLFLCVHEPVRAGRGNVRQVSIVALHQVARCEATGRAE